MGVDFRMIKKAELSNSYDIKKECIKIILLRLCRFILYLDE